MSKKVDSRNGNSSKRKKVRFKFNNDCNNVMTRSVWFANEYIINGTLQIKDTHRADALLSQVKEFELDCLTIKGDGHDA